MNFKSCSLLHADKTETLIWDWNGTLLNDVEVNRKVINEMLLKRGLKQLDVATYKKTFCFPVKNFHTRIGIDLEKESIQTISEEYMELYKKYETEIELQEDASFILDEIHARGIDQYILSAASQKDLLYWLDSFHLTGKFKKVYGSDTICATGKNVIGRKLMEENNLDIEKVLLIGDTLHDVEVAEALGIKCICYSGGHNSFDLLSQKAHVITKLNDLLK